MRVVWLSNSWPECLFEISLLAQLTDAIFSENNSLRCAKTDFNTVSTLGFPVAAGFWLLRCVVREKQTLFISLVYHHSLWLSWEFFSLDLQRPAHHNIRADRWRNRLRRYVWFRFYNEFTLFHFSGKINIKIWQMINDIKVMFYVYHIRTEKIGKMFCKMKSAWKLEWNTV